MELTLSDLLELGSKVGSGKVSSSSVSLNQAIKEAQDIAEHEKDSRTSTKSAPTRAELVARAKAGVGDRSQEREANQAKYGTADTTKVNKVAGQGPFNKGFSQLAQDDPIRAAAELDTVEGVLGLKSTNPNAPAPAPEAPIRKGVQTGSDGSDIPYYTNLPGAPGDAGGPMRNVRDLETYTPSGPRSEGLGGAAADDPKMRRVIEQIRAGRDDIQYSAKSPDVVAKEVAGKFDSAVNDIKTLGNEAASRKWLDEVAAGTLSDAAYKRLHAEAADAAQKQDDVEYEKLRDQLTGIARNEGVTNALLFLKENRAGGTGSDPKHMKRVENELMMRARPAASTEMQLTPDLYLPASRADAMQLLQRAPGTAVDKGAPPTLLNPHDGPTAYNIAAKAAEDAGTDLETIMKDPRSVGTPAQTEASYTGSRGQNRPAIPNPFPRKQKQSQVVGGAELGYEIGDGPDLAAAAAAVPGPDDIMAWLEGGGDIKRGRRYRAAKAARRQGR